ncbi:MAG TPA: hypothetical protein ENH56_13860 [Roseobacter sp.]|uniref:PemK-like protein n=1 Tax=marine sediment metagenome TaxID=412755 RepID=A0A0F9S200_9ZZZZ|nr:hypothetical protein [Roseobacter sp.]
MLHNPIPIVPAIDWTMSLLRGDVVLFRFPVSDDDDSLDVPKRRPCLVLDTFQQGQDRFVELAYGTSSKGRANRGYEVIVRQPQSQATAGLTKPTRFVCARRVTVHIRNAGFGHTEEATSPVIGRLDEALTERMNALHARFQAEAAIAAHYREEQQAEQAGKAREARGFR